MIREARIDDAEALGVAHSVAAEEAYGHYFPPEWLAARNTPAQRAEQWTETLRSWTTGETLIPADQRGPTSIGTAERILVAEAGDRILGFGIFGAAREDDAPYRHELHRLYVLAETYGSGLSAQLLNALTDGAPPHYLWVMEQNHRAIAFYRKHGYRADGHTERLPNIGHLPKIRMVKDA